MIYDLGIHGPNVLNYLAKLVSGGIEINVKRNNLTALCNIQILL